MCGIVMISKLTEDNIRMVPFMAYDMERRGYDSFGATNGQEIWKKALSVSDGWPEFEPTLWSWLGQPLILHTRGASVGKVSDENAHPFTSGEVIGVHNGHISNYADLNKTYSREFEVDSQHIIAHISENREMNDIRGWGTVVWVDKLIQELRFVTFNGGDWNVYHTRNGELVGCSEEHVIARAAGMVGLELAPAKYKIPTETRFQIPLNETDRLYKGPDMRFGSRHSYPAHTPFVHSHSNNTQPRVLGPSTTPTNDELECANDLAEAFKLALNDAVCVCCYETKMDDRLHEAVCQACITAYLRKQLWHVKESTIADTVVAVVNGRSHSSPVRELYSAALDAYCGVTGGSC